MLRSTSVVITTTGASPLIELSPVSRPTLPGAVPVDQVVVLLVRQRLDRRGVEALAALGQRQVHRELADHGLAGPGRRADQHAEAVLQRLAGLGLERVELERQPAVKSVSAGALRPPPGRRVPLGRTAHPPSVRTTAVGTRRAASARRSSGISGASTSSGSSSGSPVNARNITPIVTGESGRSVDGDLVAGPQLARLQHPQVGPGRAVRGELLDPAGPPHLVGERRARDPRRGDLQHHGPDPPHARRRPRR